MEVVSQILIKQAVVIELPLDTGGAITVGNEYTFPGDFIDKVRNKVIYGIEAVTASQLTNSSQNRPVLPAAAAPNLQLFLQEKKTNLIFVDHAPLTRFIPSLYQGTTQAFKPRMIDFTKSGVKIVATAGLLTTQSVLLLCYYRDANAEELKFYK